MDIPRDPASGRPFFSWGGDGGGVRRPTAPQTTRSNEIDQSDGPRNPSPRRNLENVGKLA
jgi:hypothetical protein